MNYLSQYAIPFSGLSEGKHLFDFVVKDHFFTAFEQSEIEKGDCKIRVELEKRSTYLALNFSIEGSVELCCDRCLEVYSQPVKSRNKLLVKFSEKEIEDEDEIIYLHPGAFQVDIAQLIYEFIVLSLPIRKVHPEGKNGQMLCDPLMIKKLEELNAFGDHESEPEDPRWNELKKIIGN